MTEHSATEITRVEWGRIEVTIDGAVRGFKDCKVWPGGAVPWDWRLTGTRHQPGTQVADIVQIVESGIDVLVLSRGMELALQTAAQTIEFLEDKGIEFHIEQTRSAVQRFNALVRAGRRVGGIFHSTC